MRRSGSLFTGADQGSSWYPQDLRKEYGKDPHFDDLVDTVIHSLKDHEHIEQRKIYTPKHLLRLFDEKVE